MARPSIVVSSLPPAALEEGLDEPLEDEIGEAGDDDSFPAIDAEAQRIQEVEAQAYRIGWRPLAEYRGDPTKWVSAEEFIERGNSYLPFVQKERDQLRGQVQALTGQIEDLRSTVQTQSKQMQQLLDFSRKASQRGFDKAMADLKAKQREAAAAADVETFDRVGDQISQMEEARADATVQDPPDAPPPRGPDIRPQAPIAPEYQAFMQANPWFNRDRTLNTAMIAEHERVMEESPGINLAASLEAAKESVMARFPKKFGLPEQPDRRNARQPRQPLPPSSPPRERRGEKGPIEAIEDPQERATARRGYLRAKRSMPDLTEAEYVETFLDPHGDVLDTIARNRPERAPARRPANVR